MRDDVDYTNILDKASRELTDLTEEMELLDDKREKVGNRIYALRDFILATSKVIGEDPYVTRPELFPELIEPETGFTDAVREVLKSSDKYFSPVDIRDELGRRRFPLGKYKNPLATIHQILKRLLVDSKEIEKHEDENKKLYRWKKFTGTRYIVQDAGGSPPRSTVPTRETGQARRLSPLPPPVPRTAKEATSPALRRRLPSIQPISSAEETSKVPTREEVRDKPPLGKLPVYRPAPTKTEYDGPVYKPENEREKKD